MRFEYPEDLEFFTELLCHNKESIETYFHFFDFRDPTIKRKEFGKLRNSILDKLINQHGKNCMLQLDVCDEMSGFAVDHLIPLSSNKLNKHIRKLKAEKGKKVMTQSFGSNHIDNLVVACNACNNNKKHRILNKEQIQRIIQRKNSKLL